MIPNRPWAVLFLLVGIGLHWAAAGVAKAQTTPAQVEGRQVTAIRIVDQSGEVLDENVSGLPLRPNQPFTLDAERESLRQLYRTGRYADIQAQVANEPGGLRVDFVVRRNYFINVVKVDFTSLPAIPWQSPPCAWGWVSLSVNPTCLQRWTA
jgi:hypothetical protein